WFSMCLPLSYNFTRPEVLTLDALIVVEMNVSVNQIIRFFQCFWLMSVDALCFQDGEKIFCHFCGHGQVPIRAVSSDGGILQAFAADMIAVIGIKIQQDAAGVQYSVPYSVGLFRIRQRPAQVPAEYHIKTLVFVLQILRIHLPE